MPWPSCKGNARSAISCPSRIILLPTADSRFFLPAFVAGLPALLRAIRLEKKRFDQILAGNRFDLIISDNRMGVYSEAIPSYFISHQLRYSLPRPLYPLELLTMPFNSLFHRRFTGLIIPDISLYGGARNLSGKLCRSRIKSTIQRSYYAGILTSTRKMNLEEDLDYLAIVSGPEPQRTALEKIILKQIQNLPGEKAVLLGSPRQERHEKLDASTTVHSYVSTEEKARLMNRARFIISRSGYTTMMEMAELGKRHALLTPTPGQTEQEYLSRYYAREGWFLSRSQYRLDLAEDVKVAMSYRGFPEMAKTNENVKRLYREVLALHLA